MNPFAGNQIFLSYRGRHINEAYLVQRWLYAQGATKVVLFEPNSLCAPNEILMPYEYVELLDDILTPMFSSAVFVYLNLPGYWDSFFTQMEILQWRRHARRPVAYPITCDSGFINAEHPVEFQPMSSSEKSAWASLSVSIGRYYRGMKGQVFMGGKFNRSTYLIPCPFCGNYFLISTALAKKVANREMQLNCSFCQGRIAIQELGAMGRYFRKPLVLAHDSAKTPRMLSPYELTELLLNNKTPDTIPLMVAGSEHFLPDWQKAVLGTVAGFGILALLISAFSSDEKD